MRLRVPSPLLVLFFLVCQLAAQTPSNVQKFSPSARTFRFTYNFTVKDIPLKRSECACGFRCHRRTSIRQCAFCRSRLRQKCG